MVKATLTKEVTVETANTMGTAAKLAELIAKQAKANIRAAWAAGVDGQGHFSLITDDNQKVIDVLKKEYPKAHEQEVLVLNVADSMGAMAEVTNQISKAGLNIDYLFTTYYENHPAIVLSTNDNKKALNLFQH